MEMTTHDSSKEPVAEDGTENYVGPDKVFNFERISNISKEG